MTQAGSPPGFTEAERWIVETALRERWGGDAPAPEDVEVEVRLRPTARELTARPALYFRQGDCHFLIVKTGDRRYRCQFFYSVREQYGTGIEEFDDLADCTVTLLRVQADQARERARAAEGG
ncbi:hypothetical protein [Inmirania thermothiophila]|uniref:Uncharacterized protein n=1 Tax=Inmirania thermothiophila TaxID=1750597 RepID=A0A3N1Y7G9_9GAMM|nr:hypothetical protein [Inmirania thermothiophila]ROR34769.1 hypothetical protein EDC57_0673 [Inmirania thermothiophila]